MGMGCLVAGCLRAPAQYVIAQQVDSCWSGLGYGLGLQQTLAKSVVDLLQRQECVHSSIVLLDLGVP